MATERLKTIKSSGGDYTSLSAAEAGEDDLSDLVSRDEWMHFSCYAMEDTDAVVLQSWTTDATRYILIDTPSSQRHDGKWNASKYRLVVTNAIGLHIGMTTNVAIDGLQVNVSSVNADYQHVVFFENSGTTGPVRLSNCILKGSDSADYRQVCFYPWGNFTTSIWNTVMYGINGRSGSTVVDVRYGTVSLYSCTGIGGETGIWNKDGTATCKNCYFGGASYDGGCFYGTISLTTCASSDSSGSVGLRSIAVNTTNFTNVTAGSENFHLPSGSALIDVGTDTSGDSAPLNFTTDIDGQTRSGSWDIGADEYVAAAAGQPTIKRWGGVPGMAINRGVW